MRLLLINLSHILLEARGKKPGIATALLLVAALPNIRAADGPSAVGATTNTASTANTAPQSQGGTNSTVLPTVTVTGDLDRAREEIAPSLGAVTYTIGPNQIQ